METKLVVLLLFTGAALALPPGPLKYYLIRDSKTWTDAQTFCRTHHIDLAVIQTAEDLLRVQTLAKVNQFSSSSWIGLYNDVNSWRWSLNDTGLGPLLEWAWGQPDNWGGHQECALIHPWGWFDEVCSRSIPFLCYDGTKTGSDRYVLYSTPKSWYEAQQFCRQNHSDLASVRDQTEFSIINSMIRWDTWFGLYRDSWKWSDHTNFSQTVWLPGCPNNFWGSENCGYLFSIQSACDEQCRNTFPSYCYRVITGQRQIVRVRVQSHQDVSDPAVSAALLQEIQQKLDQQGVLGNVTLKWREQPDGNVFHRTQETQTTVEDTSRNASDITSNLTLH